MVGLYILCVALLLSGSCGTTIEVNSTNDVTLEATPSQVQDGFTRKAALNCTFSCHQGSGFKTLVSLILSKASSREDPVYTEVASVTSLSPNNVNTKKRLGADVTGSLSNNGKALISYMWTYPGVESTGHYKCVAHGIDSTGHPIISSATVDIMQSEVDFEMVIQKLKEIDGQLDSLKDQKSKLDAQQMQLNLQGKELDDVKNRLNTSWTTMFEYKSSFQGHQYYISRPIIWNTAVADGLCRVYGGYLAEIESQQEYEFIVRFLRPIRNEQVAIGASDEGHDGKWTHLYSRNPVSYFHWGVNEPNGDNGEGCMYIAAKTSDVIFDGVCSQHRLDSRFLCEIPA